MAEEQELQRRAAVDRRVLLWSITASAAIGAGTILWGLIAASEIMIFDGLYALVGIALSGVSLLAARVAGAPADTRYPFGRPGAIPVVLVVQGGAVAGTLVYAVISAARTIAAGGSQAVQSTLLLYGLVSGLAATAVALLLTRVGRGGDLAAAEIAVWRAGALMSLLIAVGGGIGLVLVQAGQGSLAVYVDPLLVFLAVLLALPVPRRLIRAGLHELLEGAPGAQSAEAIRAAADHVRARFDLPEPTVRATKLGNRLYLDLAFVVPAGQWSVDEEDEVRRAVEDQLQVLPQEIWADVHLTTDPELAE